MTVDTFTSAGPEIFYQILLNFNRDHWAPSTTGMRHKKSLTAFIYEVAGNKSIPTQDYIKKQIVDKIIELFPGRVQVSNFLDSVGQYVYLYNCLADFNSHPDTTYEDIELVLERLAFPDGYDQKVNMNEQTVQGI